MEEHSDLIEFEREMDGFIAHLKSYLMEHSHAHVQHCIMPQCLESLRVVGERGSLILRLVLVACSSSTTLARLSWLDVGGRDHVCCYLNHKFETMKRKDNGKWVRGKHTPEVACLQEWSRLHSSIV